MDYIAISHSYKASNKMNEVLAGLSFTKSSFRLFFEIVRKIQVTKLGNKNSLGFLYPIYLSYHPKVSFILENIWGVFTTGF